jgi:hypothetical protein
MDFFRLRLINTLLVLLIGIVLGYMMKERSATTTGAAYTAKYPAKYAPQSSATNWAGKGFTADAEPADVSKNSAAALESEEPEAELAENLEKDTENFAMPIKIQPSEEETVSQEAESAARAPKEVRKDKDSTSLTGSEDAFFKNPERFAGLNLEMDLQMILARKTPKGWLLNLVHSKGGKNVDYLYVEDDSILDNNPDLKVGYFYKVRFNCRKGDTASGNKLLNLTPTNNKASWATGLSAVE